MPFLTQGKANLKYILIVLVLAVIAGGFSCWALHNLQIEKPLLIGIKQVSKEEKGCIDSGGKVSTSLCCNSASDFPNSCLIGACGCSPDNSKEIKTCDCGTDKCFNGEKCVSTKSPIAQATYLCDGGRTIQAAFYKGEEHAVEPGQPPVPSGSVKLVLSDGRNFDLAKTLSADGGRYANADESFVFWDKGDTALVLENGAEKDYKGCLIAE